MANQNEPIPWVSPRAIAAIEREGLHCQFELTMVLADKLELTPEQGARMFRMELEQPDEFCRLVGCALLLLSEEPRVA